MVRPVFLAALSLILIKNTAAAVQLPDSDIHAHCANVVSGERVQTCLVAEKYARLWLVYHAIDLATLYRCSMLFQSPTYGYSHLRACVVSESPEFSPGI